MEGRELGDLQNSFFRQLAHKGLSRNTLKNYRTDLECFNQFLLGKEKTMDFYQINMPCIEQYGHYLENRYTSHNSRRRRVQTLRIFFDFLVEKNIFPSNLVRKLPTSPKFLDIPRPTPCVDIKVLWQYLSEESHSRDSMNRLLAKRNRILILLVYGSGLKVSHLSQLKRDQLFLSSQEGPHHPRLMLCPPKRDPITIPLSDIFIPLFEDYWQDLQGEKKRSRIEFQEILFNANPYQILAGGLSPRGIELVFEDIRHKLSIQLTPKSLRQACILKWLKQDTNDSLIKEWMGVAPSYDLRPYKEYLADYPYNENILPPSLAPTGPKNEREI